MEEGAYDIGIMDSIAHFFLYGWHPGGCAWAILAHDFEGASKRAHFMSKPHVATMISLCKEIFPEHMFGSYERLEAWHNHLGYEGAPPEVKVYAKLALDSPWIRRLDYRNILKQTSDKSV